MVKEARNFTIVIKLGTSSLCDENTMDYKLSNMSQIVEIAVKLRRDGHRVIIVSSGAIAVGLKRIGQKKRPKSISANQALAAIGQARLIGLWDTLFRQLDQPIAQILLTRSDIADRSQYLNAANTFNELLNTGIIPIVNENDTLSMLEIRFGDNDTLSAITANMVNADYLFLMTDVDCLYTENPRKNPDAEPVLIVKDVAKLRVDISTAGSSVGTGGMTTKLIAAELATSVGVTMIICKSSIPGNILSIVRYLQNDERSIDFSDKSLEIDADVQRKVLDSLIRHDVPLHTLFMPKPSTIKDRQFWLLHGLTPHGEIYIDQGAVVAITRTNRAGLLPVGVIGYKGLFHSLECVSLYSAYRDEQDGSQIDETKEKKLIGRALVNYSSSEIECIKGLRSDDVSKALSWADTEYIAYRDNMAFFPVESVIAK